MTRPFVYFLTGFVFMLLQVGLFTPVLPAVLKPDLLLILVIYLGLAENYLRGGLVAFGLGCLQDVFAGNTLGLYGFVLLLTFLAVRSAADRFNTESSYLLLVLVFFGSLFEGGLLVLVLAFFADPGPIYPLIFGRLPFAAPVNLASAWILLKLLFAFQKRLAPTWQVPGLQRLDSRYES